MDNKIMAFELNHVFFKYPYEEWVLDDISIQINQGEKICILGANGCGKSTLLKMLCGLIFPQKGEIEVFGRKVSEKSFSKGSFSKEYHRKVGFIFQNSDVQLFNSTVRDEIAYGPLQQNLPLTEVEKRVEDVLHLLNISHLKNKTPFRLSGGEMKKVAIASILVLNPEVLILDEPTNGLDPRTQRWLVELLLALNNAGKTIITSTHNLELVHEISDRSLVFNENHKIEADAATETVLKDTQMLQTVNLIDQYYHSHGEGRHVHYHVHKF